MSPEVLLCLNTHTSIGIWRSAFLNMTTKNYKAIIDTPVVDSGKNHVGLQSCNGLQAWFIGLSIGEGKQNFVGD
jgi:hypothetical protein